MKSLTLLVIIAMLPTLSFSKCPENLEQWQGVKSHLLGLEESRSKSSFSIVLKGKPQIPKSINQKRSLANALGKVSSPGSVSSNLGLKGVSKKTSSALKNKVFSNRWYKCFKKVPEQMELTSLYSEETKVKIEKCRGKIKKANQLQAFDESYEQIERFAKSYNDAIRPFDLEKCIDQIKDESLKICLATTFANLETLKREKLQNKIAGTPLSGEDFFEANEEVLGVESIPEPLRSQQFLSGISDPAKVDQTVADLKTALKDKEPIIYKSNSFHKSVDLDGKSDRLIVNINENGCNKTYVISLPDDNPNSKPKQYAYLAICENDPKTGKKLETPIQFLTDYWRSYDKKSGDISIDPYYENMDMEQNCIGCHTKGPIHIYSDEKNTAQSELSEESKLNQRLGNLPKAQYASFNKDLNKYVDLFNHDYKASLGIPYGPIKKDDDKDRDMILENCLPEDPSYLSKYQGKNPKKSRRSLKRYIKNAMNCTSCHNKHDEGEIHNVDKTTNVKMIDYFKRKNTPHEMPPDLTKRFPLQDKQKIKNILLGCIDIEKNGSKRKYSRDKEFKEFLSPIQIAQIKNLDPIEKRDRELHPISSTCEQNSELAYINEIHQNCIDDQNLSSTDQNILDVAKATAGEGYNVHIIPDPVASEESPKNQLLYCKDDKVILPLFAIPGCSGGCHPFRASLEFDKDGNFKGFTKQLCERCNEDPIQKYGHVNITSEEQSQLEEYIKNSSNDPTNNTAYMDKNSFIDAYTGATRSVNYPVSGLGESTYLLNKYAKHTRDFIQNNKDSICK